MRTAGRLGGTARCGRGPHGGRRAGGPGPGLSRPLSAGPEASGGEEAARADQREPSGAAAAAGGRRGKTGRRAGGRPGAAGPGSGGCDAARPHRPPHTPPALPSAQVQAKLENAEVLELTVRRVQGTLRGRARGEWRWGAPAGRGARLPSPPPPRTGDFPARRPCTVSSEGDLRVSWVSPVPAGWLGLATAVAAYPAGRRSLPPTPGRRARAAAGRSKRALRGWLHPVHARGAHVRVHVPGHRCHRRRRTPEPPARVHASARGQQLQGSAGGRPGRASGSPRAKRLAHRRGPGVPSA